MPPILLAVFHCSLYREHISSWGGGGLISIPAPPRGATGEVMHNIIVFEISIHAPPRGATSHGMPCLTSKSISIHAPPRGATRALQFHPCYLQFQFTPLREGRLDYDELNIECEVFQFTPLREGRRLGWGLRPFALGISIHAPPRGATRACVQTQRRLQTISIHAPPRGATTAGIFDATRRPYFNSRPSARGDLTRARIIYSNSQNSGQ